MCIRDSYYTRLGNKDSGEKCSFEQDWKIKPVGKSVVLSLYKDSGENCSFVTVTTTQDWEIKTVEKSVVLLRGKC